MQETSQREAKKTTKAERESGIELMSQDLEETFLDGGLNYIVQHQTQQHKRMPTYNTEGE